MIYNIGDKIECILNDNTVIPIYVGIKYTITDIRWDSKFEIFCYFIDNNNQCYDEIEFSSLFKKNKLI